jgi:dienelactone hydrolase
MDEVRERLDALTAEPERTRRIARAGLDVLLHQERTDPDRVAAIGYCFGAVVSLELARTGADIKAVVGFHPGLMTPRPADSRNIQGSVLLCCGTDDPYATPDQRLAFENEMRDAGVDDWRIELYGRVKHSFTNPGTDRVGIPGIAYNALADRRSWRSMLELFDDTLGPV